MRTLTNAAVSLLVDGTVNLCGLEQALGFQNGSHVLIIGTASNFLRIIPISTDSVIIVRVSFALPEFANSARDVLQTLKNLDIKMIHSTGFCPLDDICLWEGYFEGNEKEQIEKFVGWLHTQAAVLDVHVEHLSWCT